MTKWLDGYFNLPGLDKILNSHYNLKRQSEEVRIYERKI